MSRTSSAPRSYVCDKRQEVCTEPPSPSVKSGCQSEVGFSRKLCQLPPCAFTPTCLMGKIMYSMSEPVNISAEKLWKVGMIHPEAAVWVPGHPSGQLEFPLSSLCYWDEVAPYGGAWLLKGLAFPVLLYLLMTSGSDFVSPAKGEWLLQKMS